MAAAVIMIGAISRNGRLRLPETRVQLETLGFDVIGSTPDEFTAFAKQDLAKWAKTLKEAGIKPEM